ncbi:MAG: ECF transporter S component [Clostridia bacterium]|nr:ECF transporter S component [Clostridia bacterium]
MNQKSRKILISHLIRVAACAMLSAMSFVLFLLEFPVTPPAMGHLKMDFSDIPALFAGVVFGPFYAVVVELVKNVLELITKGIGTQMGFGNLMNFIVGCAYVVPFSFVLRKHKDEMKDTKTILTAAFTGLITIVVLGIGANYFIAPLFFKHFLGIVIDDAGLWTAVASATALNAIKGLMLSVVAFPLVRSMVDRVRKIAKMG